jgi:hypothetical protein
MRAKILILVLVVSFVFCSLYAWVPFASHVWLDPAVRMPGTQPPFLAGPGQFANLEGPGRCLNCHAGYDPNGEPGGNWKGSMMAQAARDPLFWACFTVALQDSIWVLGNPDAGDICLRCHFPEGWLEGRSNHPLNASLMADTDFDGVHCDFCHRMYDPFFETSYHGTRESNDWPGYWDESNNTGPGSGTLSQTEADATYLVEQALVDTIFCLSGTRFFDSNMPLYSTYDESTGGQYFVDIDPNSKRGEFADAHPNHEKLYSRFHKSKYYCGTCHDVSNPALANQGLSDLADQSQGQHLITEQYPASRYFHIERTFSEFMLSDYGQYGGAATNTEFELLSGGISHAGKCQDCHMRDIRGYGSNKSGSPLRPDESIEHPNLGVPKHDMTGGSAWASYILASLDPAGPIYDPCNVQILDKGPAVLTLDLDVGQSPKDNGPALKAGSDRALDQLRMAATVKGLTYDPCTGDLAFRIQNNTAHKLLTGFPEGRRVFVNVKAYAKDQQLMYEVNPYDYSAGTLRGLPNAPASPALEPNETYVDELVYELHFESSITGEQETFHAAVATGRYKDNRIPPKGFDVSSASERLSEPTWHGQSKPDYFGTDEYAGGYDRVYLQIPAAANAVSVTVYHQATSREYIEFLRDQINGDANTLSSPTPSGEPNAYIIQTDPFFSQLKEWGNTIWDLWYHNHGLDGGGASVPGIVPFEMASAALSQAQPLPMAGDSEPDGDVDYSDVRVMAGQWLQVGPDLSADVYPFGGDGIVDTKDFALLAQNWRKGVSGPVFVALLLAMTKDAF